MPEKLEHIFKTPSIEKTIERLDVLGELEKEKDKELEVPQAREKTERLLELDKRWSKELEPLVEGLDMTTLVAVKGREGRSTDEEKDDFLKSLDKPESNFNPTFEYPHLKKYNLDQIETSLRKLKGRIKQEEPEVVINELYRYKVNVEIAQVMLAKNILLKNDRNTFRYAKFIYGEVTDELFQRAQERYKEMLKQATEKKEEKKESKYKDLAKKIYRAEDIKKYFTMALQEYGLEGRWKVEISKRAKVITVKQRAEGGPEILIPPKRKVNPRELIRLIAHEVETHVLRAENGRLSGLEILKGNIGLDRHHFTEEGLAILRENMVIKEVFKEKERKALSWYALAMYRVKQGANFRETFLDIYEKRKKILLAKNKDEEKADQQAKRMSWGTCRRIFRGMTDLSSRNGYYFPMDLAYLAGEMEVEKLLKKGYGQYLELGKTNIRALPDIVNLGIRPENIRYPYKNVAKKIWEEELRPGHLI
ncbi:MAG: DUF1704 domain-containing protein [Candidatus Portnoybacteria bacterium]|nr:DUF1704 domain-containing protein [Candidatus Portnoybacteria bacterium]